MPRGIGAVVGACLAVLGCSALAGCSSEPEPEGLAWRSCGTTVDVSAAHVPADRFPHLSFGCATVEVPLAPTTPGRVSAAGSTGAEERSGDRGSTLEIHLVRIHHDGTATEPAQAAPSPSSASREPLLLIAGGPGQSGVDNAVFAAGYLPTELFGRFDLVGFDPRGVGRSDPIRCRREDAGTPPLVDLATTEGYEFVAASTRRGTASCLTALGARAEHYSTTETAMDVDLIREALGQEALTYVGWSYGAKLGAEYARLFPHRVRAAVLDAPTDPTVTWLETTERQVAGFEESFDRFAAWCSARPDCDGLGDVRALATRLVDEAEATPIPSGRPGDDVPSTGGDLLNGVVSALYLDVRWPDLAAGLAEADAGDSGTLRELGDAEQGARREDTNAADALFVINCNDSAAWPSESEIRATAGRLAKQHPLFGRWGSPQLLMCAYWSPPRHTLRPPVAATANRVLVVGTVHDPATPYAGAAAMATSLGNATLLTWEGVGHTAFGRSPCVNEHVTAYLTDLRVPPEGTRCPP